MLRPGQVDQPLAEAIGGVNALPLPVLQPLLQVLAALRHFLACLPGDHRQDHFGRSHDSGSPASIPTRAAVTGYAVLVLHSSWLASRAPSAIAASFAQVIFGSTGTKAAKVAKPQSLPAITFSRPTTPA